MPDLLFLSKLHRRDCPYCVRLILTEVPLAVYVVDIELAE